ncbi:MAG TPA: STAS domain-containing protein [Spirochaetia bacterium]|nr:STAS domain-containing protein [Spirochaetia bacterium]
MPIRTSTKDGTTTIGISGESTVADSESLAASLRAAAGSASPRISVDLSGLVRCDVTVPQLLVALAKTLEAAGKEFGIVELDARHPVRSAFESMGFHLDQIDRTVRPTP